MTEAQQAQTQPQEGAEGQVQETTSKATSEATSEATDKASEAQEKQSSDTKEGQEPTSIEDLPEWVQKEIKALRKENAKARTERQKQEDAQKTQQQKLSEELEEIALENATLMRQVRRSAFIETIGLPNPKAAWGYVLDGVVEVEWDENNRPKDLEGIRKTLKQEDGALFGNGSADGGAKGVGNVGYQGAPGPGRIKYAYENNKT